MKIDLPSLLFFSFVTVFTSCKGQVRPDLPKDSLKTAPPLLGGTQTELEAYLAKGIDPYFVESKDTVSAHGPKCIVRDLLHDRSGNIWLASWMGIIKYDGKVFTNYTLRENLIHFHVFSCYEDSKGVLWFGTARGGVYRYDGKAFTLFTKKNGLPDNSVQCFAEDKDGNMWFGTDSGASRYDGKIFANFTKRDGLAGNSVRAMIKDRTGKLWFGGQEGITCYDGKSFTLFADKKEHPVKKVTALFEDKAGNIWIGRFEGLCCYDGKNFTDHLTNLLSYYITKDEAGNIWLTHSEPNPYYSNLPNQVLYKYDGKEFTAVIEKNEPQDCQIFGKAIDNSGNVWFGTMNGPCRYDGKTFTTFSE
jgi:ligand-binding sensor domain-containing protein